MPRDIRARLWDEIATSQNNVLTSTQEIEHATATRELNLSRIARAKLMLAALDGQENEFSSVFIEVPAPPPQVRWWHFKREGAPCPPPAYTHTPLPVSQITRIAALPTRKSGHST